MPSLEQAWNTSTATSHHLRGQDTVVRLSPCAGTATPASYGKDSTVASLLSTATLCALQHRLVVWLQRLLEMAELREGVLQQLQSLEAAKMRMAEQKLAEQTRLCSDLDVRLQAACSSLDCAAGGLLLPHATIVNVAKYAILCHDVTLFHVFSSL